MKILFCGLGSIGTRHLRLLAEQKKIEIYAFRTNHLKKNDFCTELTDWVQVQELKPDIAFITNPTSLHIETAIKLAELGTHLFIEKPLDVSDLNLDKLLSIIKQKKIVTYLAYNLRFHPVIEKLKSLVKENTFLHMRAQSTSYLPNWRPGQDFKKSYSSHEEMGGGVILDLSHELDYTSYILGEVKSIEGSFGRASDLTVSSEDYANLIVETLSGPALIHLNYFSHRNSRVIEMTFKEFTVVGDIINSTVEIYVEGKVIESFSYPVDRDYTYKKQLDYFFANVNERSMMNNIESSSGLFRKMIEFKRNRSGK